MTELSHQPCPYVDCESSDAFSYNTEKMTGKCHSCGTGYPSSDEMFDWAREEYPIKDTRKMSDDYQDKWDIEPASTTYEGIRGIDSDVCKLYGIQLQLDSDGEPLRYAFKYSNNVKYRLADVPPDGSKKNAIRTKTKGVGMNELFGPPFNSNTSKRIYVTEGEFDAASLYQILGKSFPVVSLPSAGVGDKFMKANYDFLNSFQEIVYAGELSDEAGRKAADRFYEAFPTKLWYVPMSSHKDANAFLMAGDEDDLSWTARKPQRYSPENFFCSDEEFSSILREENPYESTPTGLKGLDHMTRGLVRGGLTFLLAPPGTGKTEILRYFERSMLNHDDQIKIGCIHMEEMKATTLRAMATYELGVNVRTKEDAVENNVTEKQVEEAALKAAKGDRTILFEMRQGDDPLEIIEYCRLACGVYGADYIFVDHVQRLAYLGGIDGATNILTKVSSNLAQLAKELNVGIILISHVNEDGHTKYARSLEEEAIIVIKISRDKNAEDEQDRNTTTFHIEKNRPFSRLGEGGKLYYDPETTILEELDDGDFN